MAHFIVKAGDQYLLPRRATGRLYENRTAFGKDKGEARVFNTKAAATNSARSAGKKTFDVVLVSLVEQA